MSSKSILITLSTFFAVAATPALADHRYEVVAGEYGFQEHAVPRTSAKTRAEVKAELEQARRDGTLWYTDRSYSLPSLPIADRTSTRTREEVRNEVRNMSAAERRYLAQLYRN
jgi:hypothetical protein